ncbi:MAG: (d)CMP kinase [Bacilli bacterium]|nr:(d)CMP kinase [Bacilli bacterium]
MVIAIDGPAGSGKGTVAKILSERLNILNIDTGATYRCVALKTIQNNIDIKDEEAIIKIASDIDIKETNDGKVYLDNKDVTKEIRSKEVTTIVSQISSIVKVREYMVDVQRNMANDNDVVMEGRDITTVVFPNADYKFYLDASLKVRADRRYKENKEKNIDMTYEEIYENIKQRDYNDMHKKVGSLMRTDEQIYIDSSDLSIDEVVEKMLEVIKK